MTVVGTLIVEPVPGVTAYQIEVDGVAKGEVRAGHELKLALAPGAHVVRARRTLRKGAELHVHLGPAETVRLRADARLGLATI
jgi:hypothetical protein